MIQNALLTFPFRIIWFPDFVKVKKLFMLFKKCVMIEKDDCIKSNDRVVR